MKLAHAFIATLAILTTPAVACVSRTRPATEYGTLKVKVLDEQGRALEAVRVTVRVTKGYPTIVKVTDHDGIAEFPRTSRKVWFTLFLEHEGFVNTETHRLGIGRAPTMTVIATPPLNRVILDVFP